MRFWVLVGAILASLTSIAFAQGTFTPGGGGGGGGLDLNNLTPGADTVAQWDFERSLADTHTGSYPLTRLAGTASWGPFGDIWGVRCITRASEASLPTAGTMNVLRQADSVFAITGDLTIHVLMMTEDANQGGDAIIVSYDGGNTDAANTQILYQIRLNQFSNNVQYTSEDASHANSNVHLSSAGPTDGVPLLLSIVRESNSVQWYFNGEATGSPGAVNQPGGALNSDLTICKQFDVGTTFGAAEHLVIFSLQINDAAQSAAEVLAVAEAVGVK